MFQTRETVSKLFQLVFIKILYPLGLVLQDQGLETLNFDVGGTFSKIDVDIVETEVFELLQGL